MTAWFLHLYTEFINLSMITQGILLCLRTFVLIFSASSLLVNIFSLSRSSCYEYFIKQGFKLRQACEPFVCSERIFMHYRRTKIVAKLLRYIVVSGGYAPRNLYWHHKKLCSMFNSLGLQSS